jgi:hypothetical protein
VKSRSSVCMQGDLDRGASVPIPMEEPVTVPPPVRIGELGTSERSGRVQDWRQLFQSEKTLGSLQYFEPRRQDGKIIVQPPKEAIEEGISKWSSSLIGQFLDKPLPFYVVKRTIERIWASYGSVEVFLLDNGLFLFRFANESIREAVPEEKLWHIANKPLILRRWAPGMQLLKLSLASVPIWIKLHNLPMEFWNSTCLSHVASGIGKPICADSVTMEQCRLGFARVLVEVDVNADFPKEIELLGLNGEVNKVGIEYPWLPIKCKKCHNFGHATHTCTKIEKAVWVPKKEPARAQPAPQVDKVASPRTVKGDTWNVVSRDKKTPKTRAHIVDNSKHWTNSFQFLARVDGRTFDNTEIRKSNDALKQLLDAEMEPGPLVDKGKGKLEEDEEMLMRGFSPHS